VKEKIVEICIFFKNFLALITIFQRKTKI